MLVSSGMAASGQSAETAAQVERGMRVWEILDHAARLHGPREAFVCGDERLSYRAVEQRARRLAAALLALGVEPGARVGVLMLNCHRYAELYFAADYAGLVPAPLNHRLAPAELIYILDHAEASVLVVDPRLAELAEAVMPALSSVKHVIWSSQPAGRAGMVYDELLSAQQPLAHAVPRDPGALAQLYYTSGTTGNPKGAMLSGRAVTSAALLNLVTTGLSTADSYLRCAPAFHLADAWANFAVTLAGGRHIFLPGFAPESFLQTVAAERITVTLLVPTMITALVTHPSVRAFDTSSLRTIYFGASPMPAERLRAALQTFTCEFSQWYGMTEAYPAVTCLPAHELDLDGPPSVARRVLSCGRQVAGVQVRVVDGLGAEVAPGEVGEIVIKGPILMSGYWRNPPATAAALRDGWMHSGDGAMVDEDGYIFIVDRLKDMIITGGENVYTTEVEDVLYRHPAVLECAVIGVPDERWGERVHAVVALRAGQQVSVEEIIAFSRGEIAGYKCPRTVEFVAALPKTGSGKIQKSVLRAPYWTGRDRQIS
jgi:acyl-CoA synthetase (AMP-forming)/AMP-acid ligase II